jgi:hypothetical protein
MHRPSPSILSLLCAVFASSASVGGQASAGAAKPDGRMMVVREAPSAPSAEGRQARFLVADDGSAFFSMQAGCRVITWYGAIEAMGRVAFDPPLVEDDRCSRAEEALGEPPMLPMRGTSVSYVQMVEGIEIRSVSDGALLARLSDAGH